MDKNRWPEPAMMAVASGKDEQSWFPITSAHEFKFSIYPRSFIEVVKADGQILAGYFQGLNRALGAITLSNDKDSRRISDNDNNSMSNIGARTLLTIKKYNVDRFGARSEVKSEVRTWHGVVCTSPIQPG
jgi:CRISPR-associated endonuclease Csn1